MAETYLTLSREDRLEALGVAATSSGRPIHLLEKDVWVVWALDALFSSEFGQHLVFKGGTSLSKVYDVIRRFSEDIDVTYDVRELIPELIGIGSTIPKSNSQAKKWRHAIDEKLPAWVKDKVLPIITRYAEATGVAVEVSSEGDKIYIDYDPLAKGKGYVAPRVTIEFGARSTGEPCEERPVVCDAAEHLSDVKFPTATPRAMLPKRTFWEKATAIHVYCRGAKRENRFARHWHDLVRLDDAGHAQEAFDDDALAKDVATFKGKFFRERDRNDKPIDYTAAVSGDLQLVPDAEATKELEADYKKMADDGILLDDAEPFADLIRRCANLQKRANARRK
jgi:nucleotidyltransferase AbiEii toxin of type IV toxin-antitoxin system